MEFLHPAMWHVALESWQWIHQVAAPCNVTRSSGIMTLNSPGGSTLQCGRWLWDHMPLNSSKRPPYWNYTSGFDFDHITAVDMAFCTSLRNFIQIRQCAIEICPFIHLFVTRLSCAETEDYLITEGPFSIAKKRLQKYSICNHFHRAEVVIAIFNQYFGSFRKQYKMGP